MRAGGVFMSRILAAVVVAVMLSLVPIIAPLPAGAANIVTIQVCQQSPRDGCGQPIPTGAPWLIYVIRGVAPGQAITVDGGCLWTGTRFRNLWCYDTSVTGSSWTPGEQQVVVTDTASGTELARATYQVVPQTSDEAAVAFKDKPDAFSRAGEVLARARGGDLDQALRAAEAMSRDGAAFTQFQSFDLRVNVLLALHRPHEALTVAQEVVAWRRAHTQPPESSDYELIARAAVAACDLSTAEQAAGQASLLAPGDAGVQRLLVEIEQAKFMGGCAAH